MPFACRKSPSSSRQKCVEAVRQYRYRHVKLIIFAIFQYCIYSYQSSSTSQDTLATVTPSQSVSQCMQLSSKQLPVHTQSSVATSQWSDDLADDALASQATDEQTETIRRLACGDDNDGGGKTMPIGRALSDISNTSNTSASSQKRKQMKPVESSGEMVVIDTPSLKTDEIPPQAPKRMSTRQGTTTTMPQISTACKMPLAAGASPTLSSTPKVAPVISQTPNTVQQTSNSAASRGSTFDFGFSFGISPRQ